MAALTDKAIRIEELGGSNDLPIKAATKIYEGAAVGIDSADGYSRGLVAGDRFGGFATETVDNTGAAGAKEINVDAPNNNKRLALDVASAVITDVGLSVYASDEDAFTMTSTSNTLIGTAIRFVAAGKLVVQI